jgi:hypothetical protein
VLSEYVKYLYAKMRRRFDSLASNSEENRISDLRQ